MPSNHVTWPHKHVYSTDPHTTQSTVQRWRNQIVKFHVLSATHTLTSHRRIYIFPWKCSSSITCVSIYDNNYFIRIVEFKFCMNVHCMLRFLAISIIISGRQKLTFDSSELLTCKTSEHVPCSVKTQRISPN